MQSMTLHQLHQIVGGRLRLATLGPRDGEWTHLGRYCADSRQLQPGEIFWAVQGNVHDGAAFVESAFARGASGVISTRYVQPWPGCWALQVEDSREALSKLALWHRQQFSGQVVAVGGVAGTATTRRLISTVLGSRFTGTSSPQRDHRQDTVALGMLSLEPQHDFAVFDFNLSMPGDVGGLVAECGPSIGVITDVTSPRTAGTHFSRLHDTASQLLSQLPEDGHAVLGGDDPAIRRLAEHCRCRTTWVGESSECDLVATRVLSTDGRLCFDVDGQTFNVAAWGRHQLTSVLCAIGVGRQFGMSMSEIARALACFDLPPDKFDAVPLSIFEPTPVAAGAAAPSILKFKAVTSPETIVGRLQMAARKILRFDAGHQLTLFRAA